ncbi:hypothetical protein [Aeromicrobium sp. CF3.5]|uniref:hypothetical protein n=1 Tax=Aeromicrobium sp. CF3.5 TaxID=3373078 RepID=UPI003EE72FF2
MMAALERREHLIIGAVTGDISDDEQRELDALMTHDLSVRTEIEQMQDVVSRVDDLDHWAEVAASPDLDAAIAAIADADAAPVPVPASGIRPRAGHRSTGRRATTRREASPSTRRSPTGRSLPWRGVAAAAALVVAGAGGALGIERVVDHSSIVSGEPGTLGAAEDISFASEGAGQVDGSVVAHTWGTEAMLTVDGLETGRTYDVLFVDERGSTIDAGSFLGSEVQINCSMNAAIMREDVASVRIVADDGTTVRAADLPQVSS